MAFRSAAFGSAAFRGASTKSAGRGRESVEHDEGVDLSRLMVDEITWYMREHKVSRAQLAQSMNVSAGRISQVLSGDENLTLRTLSGVLTALGTQVDFSLRPQDDPVELIEPEDYDDRPRARRR